jgi:hypothetical protein
MQQIYHKYTDSDGLIISDNPNFNDYKWLSDKKIDWDSVGGDEIMIANSAVNKIFPGCEWCSQGSIKFCIPNDIIIVDTGDRFLIKRYRGMKPILRIQRSQLMLLTRIFKLVKNKLVIRDSKHRIICIIKNRIHCQADGFEYKNDALRRNHLINRMLCKPLYKQLMMHYNLHVVKVLQIRLDTNDVTTFKKHIREWRSDIKIKTKNKHI